jgi:formylglycine-generating enzyme required for sulfatase activity
VTRSLVFVFLAGCVSLDGLSGGVPDGGNDAGQDSGFDAGVDAGSDAGVDAGIDAGQDAGTDAGTDAGSDAGTDAGMDAGTTCDRFTRGPHMVLAGRICIDSTEVTNGQYLAFLESGPDGGGQSTDCQWDTDFNPANICPLDPGKPTYPVNGVDWCDAWAFCRWAGKRLCGGTDGGIIVTSSYAVLHDANISERTAVCSHNNAHKYPYGDTFGAEACAGGERTNEPITTVPVGSLTTCEGGYPGVFDMAGNVHEWENACQSVGNGAADNCWFRGGSYHDNDDSCITEDYATTRDYVDSLCDIGFRCCADP